MPSSDWMPTLDRVGGILRARTKDVNGRELGTFTVDTRPTDTEVSELIDQAQSDVISATGADIPESTWGDAAYVTALGAAMLVELSYFPEQVGSNRSVYTQVKTLYDERLGRLIRAVEAAGGTTSGEGGTSLLTPAYSFPMMGDPFIIGRRTPW